MSPKSCGGSWAADTCSPDDLERAGWSAENPAWGQCDVTALIVNDLFGGDLMLGEVHCAGEQHGYHWWNRLGDGSEIDLTREQFRLGQVDHGGACRRAPAGPAAPALGGVPAPAGAARRAARAAAAPPHRAPAVAARGRTVASPA